MVNVGSRTLTKAKMVAEIANDLIGELVERARRSDGLRDYYDLAIFGYSGQGVRSLLGSERELLPITEVDAMCSQEQRVDYEYRLESGEVRFFSHYFRPWITPEATGDTPMYEALLTVHDLVDEWCSRAECSESFPPMIFNITDGESTDCDYIDIEQISSRIKALSTRDGNALLFNIHIASDSSCPSLIFPSKCDIDSWTDRSALSLYNSASTMPALFANALAEIKGCERVESVKAMSFNASASEVVTILNIGSRSVKCG